MFGYAILGCGYVSGRHIEAAMRLADVRVAVLCDIDLAAAEAAAAKYELTCPITADFREAVSRPDVDIVVVGLPTPLHCEAGKAAAEAGKHIYMEKPLAQSLEEARELMAACEQAGVKMVVGHSHRYFPALRRARQLVLDGVIGRPVKVRSVLCYFKDFANEKRPWKLDASLPLHGSVLDVGVHAADDIHFVVDSRTIRLYAEGGCARPDETALTDVALAAMRLENGAVAEWEISETQPTDAAFPCQGTTEVYGTLGSILVDNNRLLIHTRARDGREDETVAETLAPARFFDPWDELHRDFIASIRNDTPVPIEPLAGYRSLQVVDAVFTSIRSHTCVELP
ncbi:MAG: Gfo/Idh/MocA family oxidoreductase [Victivallales bacterium]|nr:Gfo/Idh/MocA family oxidoreductase [Victivallales bacterium]